VADALSRLPADIKTSEIHAYEPSEHLKDEEFILAVTASIEDSNTNELMTDCQGKANVWTAFWIQYDSVENKQENLQKLNPNAAIFVRSNLMDQKITAIVTPLNNQDHQIP